MFVRNIKMYLFGVQPNWFLSLLYYFVVSLAGSFTNTATGYTEAFLHGNSPCTDTGCSGTV